jgi:hypothetical protein
MSDRIECIADVGLFANKRQGTWLFSELRGVAKSSNGEVTLTHRDGHTTQMVLGDTTPTERTLDPSFAQVRRAETQLLLAREWQADVLQAWNRRQ